MDSLSNRQMQILQAIILNYLETAEPVGSRTISRRSPLGLSSATIRNEMADLEELGFIVQPHTSAGRIPSSKGYRLYVDSLLQSGRIPTEDETRVVSAMLQSKTRQLDAVLREIGELLSVITRYPTVVTMPNMNRTKLKHLQLIPVDDHSAVLMIVTDGNVVRNHMISMDHALSQDEADMLSSVLNRNLQGLAMEEINLPVIQKLRRELGTEQQIVSSLLDAIQSTVEYANDTEMYTAGTTNILDFPEFSDVQSARAVMEVFHKKDEMLSTIRSTHPAHAVQNLRITIGKENELTAMQDCSVITTTYTVGGETRGTVSVIGPVRMDYGKVISTLGSMMTNLQRALTHNDETQEERNQHEGREEKEDS
jgi:heat-inducible transcriptional repressor